MRIDRCTCINQTFEDLLAKARAGGLSLAQLSEQTKACQQCGLCKPYLKQTLLTGQVVFHELLSDDNPSSQH